MPFTSRRALLTFNLGCLGLLLPSLLAFLVNVEVGLRIFFPGLRVVEQMVPAGWFRFGAALSADLSAISTLVPVLLLIFPLYQGLRIGRAGDRSTLAARELVADPYPPHFAFFLVMLGMVGTLYGMLIGLQDSGVSTLGASPLDQESVQRTLGRLIGGTATAILSSLVGIVGAFLAARPIPWLFRRVTGATRQEGPSSLTETLDELTHDLQNLGAAARDLMQQLPPDITSEFQARLDRLEAGIRDLARHLSPLAGHLETIRRDTGLLAGQAGRLEAVERSLQEQGGHLARLQESLSGLALVATRTNDLLERRLTEAREQQQALRLPLETLAAASQDMQRAGQAERESLRRALAQYVTPRD